MVSQQQLTVFRRLLTLPEYEVIERDQDEVPEPVGEYIAKHLSDKVDTEFPTPRTDGKWQFRNLGYAGKVELPQQWTLVLEPNIDIERIFQMIQYAYELPSVEFLGGSVPSQATAELFTKIVQSLVDRVIWRQRRGLYKTYVSREERSEVIRGSIDFSEHTRRPWDHKHRIEYNELTVDNKYNQILLWTLFKTASIGIEDEDTAQRLRKAYRLLSGAVTLRQFSPDELVGFTYKRENADYETLHNLCRLILENSSPDHRVGEYELIPFLVDLPTLFERFVVNWMKQNLPASYSIKSQFQIQLGAGKEWYPDFVLFEGTGANKTPICVADTKYISSGTPPNRPKPGNLSQVVSYATELGVDHAVLIYPDDIGHEFCESIGGIRTRTAIFDVTDDVNTGGERFLMELFASLDRFHVLNAQ